jgi:hypothetical protein
VSHKGAVSHRFLAYSSPSRLPDPDHLAVLARPGFVRAAPALSVITRIRLPSAPPPCCDRAAVKVSHLHSNLSASRRTHDLRHTGNQFAGNSGARLRDLMARMGHDSERAAMIYQHVARGADKVITDAIDTHVQAEKRGNDGAAGLLVPAG